VNSSQLSTGHRYTPLSLSLSLSLSPETSQFSRKKLILAGSVHAYCSTPLILVLMRLRPQIKGRKIYPEKEREHKNTREQQVLIFPKEKRESKKLIGTVF